MRDLTSRDVFECANICEYFHSHLRENAHYHGNVRTRQTEGIPQPYLTRAIAQTSQNGACRHGTSAKPARGATRHTWQQSSEADAAVLLQLLIPTPLTSSLLAPDWPRHGSLYRYRVHVYAMYTRFPWPRPRPRPRCCCCCCCCCCRHAAVGTPRRVNGRQC